MRGAWTIAVHELRALMQDRSGLIWSFLMPLVFAAFFGLVFSGGGRAAGDARAYLSVLDEDRGPAAQRLLAALEAGHLELHPIAPEQTAGETAGASRVRTLIIPAGFSAALAAGTPVTLRLEKEPDTSEQAALVVQSRILAATARLIADLVVDELAVDDLAAAAAPAPGDPRPPLVRLETRYAGSANVIPSGFSHSVPGNAVMFVLLVALTYGAAALTGERRAGTLRRLATAPISRGEIVLGKVLGRVLIALVQITVFVLAGAFARRFLALDLGGDLGAMWLVLAVYALAVAPLGVLFGAVFREPEPAANVGTVATLGMAALGGCWWPLEIVPESMQRIALLFPTGWAMRALHRVVSFGHGLDATLVPLLVLLAFGAVFTVLAARLLKVT